MKRDLRSSTNISDRFEESNILQPLSKKQNIQKQIRNTFQFCQRANEENIVRIGAERIHHISDLGKFPSIEHVGCEVSTCQHKVGNISDLDGKCDPYFGKEVNEFLRSKIIFKDLPYRKLSFIEKEKCFSQGRNDLRWKVQHWLQISKEKDNSDDETVCTVGSAAPNSFPEITISSNNFRWILESKEMGLGLQATKQIEKNSLLFYFEYTYRDHVITYDEAEERMATQPHPHFIYWLGESCDRYIDFSDRFKEWDHIRYMNHSCVDVNARVCQLNKKIIGFKANRKIRKGEFIHCDYYSLMDPLMPRPNKFKCFCHSKCKEEI